LLGLQILSSFSVKHVEAFGDSLLAVQEIFYIYPCFDGSLNVYLDRCLKNIATFDDFTTQHVSRDENIVVNDLAQQASDFRSNREKLYNLEKSDVPISNGCKVPKVVLLNSVLRNQIFRN
jgi:hypothetical protein